MTLTKIHSLTHEEVIRWISMHPDFGDVPDRNTTWLKIGVGNSSFLQAYCNSCNREEAKQHLFSANEEIPAIPDIITLILKPCTLRFDIWAGRCSICKTPHIVEPEPNDGSRAGFYV